MLVNCVANSSTTRGIWSQMMQWMLSDACGGIRLQGTAPRNGKERSIVKILDSISGPNKKQQVSAQPVDADEDS